MIEERGLVLKKLVVAIVEPVDFCQGKIGSQQIGKSALIEPVAMQAPFTARVDESVEDEGLEDLIPA